LTHKTRILGTDYGTVIVPKLVTLNHETSLGPVNFMTPQTTHPSEFPAFFNKARVVELVDTQDLGGSVQHFHVSNITRKS
jgi:hypothetical protein